MPRKRVIRGICPRCGRGYLYLEEERRGNRVYTYAYHGRDEEGRKVRCYLGPRDGYVYARLGGALEQLEALLQHFLEASPEEAYEAARIAEEFLARLKSKNILRRAEGVLA